MLLQRKHYLVLALIVVLLAVFLFMNDDAEATDISDGPKECFAEGTPEVLKHEIAKHTRERSRQNHNKPWSEWSEPTLWTPKTDVTWVVDIPEPTWQEHGNSYTNRYERDWALLPTGNTKIHIPAEPGEQIPCDEQPDPLVTRVDDCDALVTTVTTTPYILDENFEWVLGEPVITTEPLDPEVCPDEEPPPTTVPEPPVTTVPEPPVTTPPVVTVPPTIPEPPVTVPPVTPDIPENPPIIPEPELPDEPAPTITPEEPTPPAEGQTLPKTGGSLTLAFIAVGVIGSGVAAQLWSRRSLTR